MCSELIRCAERSLKEVAMLRLRIADEPVITAVQTIGREMDKDLRVEADHEHVVAITTAIEVLFGLRNESFR